MKKYYFNDGTTQQGPFTLEELKGKNITAATPVWYEGLADWTTAGQVEELKDVIIHTPPPFHSPQPVAEESKPAVVTEPASTIAATATPASSAKVVAAPVAKKKTAWLSWVLYLLVLGGVGYFVYDNMEKNQTASNGNITGPNEENVITLSDSETEMQPVTPEKHEVVVTDDEAAKDESLTTVTVDRAENQANLPPVATTNKTTQPVTVIEKAKSTKTQEAQKAAQQKAELEKQKQQAALAAAAMKEKEYRNNWARYITVGKLNYTTNDDGVEAFNVPVYNGTNALLDKVTLRVDYMKKEKKVMKSETIVIYNIPAGAGLNGKAPESKKGNNIKVYITAISSRKLHFCYPVNNGNSDDPYYCNQ